MYLILLLTWSYPTGASEETVRDVICGWHTNSKRLKSTVGFWILLKIKMHVDFWSISRNQSSRWIWILSAWLDSCEKCIFPLIDDYAKINTRMKTYIFNFSIKVIYNDLHIYHISIGSPWIFPERASIPYTAPEEFGDAEYESYEFFAGVGNLTTAAKAAGYRSLRFDIKDATKPKNRRSNYMDLNSDSGFASLGFLNYNPLIGLFSFDWSWI